MIDSKKDHPGLVAKRKGWAMSMRAVEFVENWVSDNVDDEEVDPKNLEAHAADLAARCLEEAVAAGIPKSEIEDTFDDLAAFMAGEIGEAQDRDDDEDEDEDDDEEEIEEEEEKE
jgi:hypothetical protein